MQNIPLYISSFCKSQLIMMEVKWDEFVMVWCLNALKYPIRTFSEKKCCLQFKYHQVTNQKFEQKMAKMKFDEDNLQLLFIFMAARMEPVLWKLRKLILT